MTDFKNEDHPKNLLALIDNVDFPASKTELVAAAEDSNASESALEVFRALQHESYNSINDVNEDLGLIEELPGQTNLFASKSA